MNLLVRLTTAALFCLAASASAEIIGVEQFDYPDSVIATKSGGTFWDYKNFTPIGHNGTASTWDNFSGAPVVTSGRLVTSNSSVKREYNGTLESDGAVNDPASVPSSVAKTVYYRVTFTTGATLPSFLSISSSDFGTDIVSFGVSLNVANDNKFAIRIHPLSFTLSNNPTLIVANTTYTLVLKLDYTNNLASLYLNPDLNAAEGAVTPLLAATNFTPTNWSTSLRLASGTGGSVTWDDLVAATTWDELGTVVTTTTDEDGSLNPATGTGVSLREAVKYSPAGSLITFDSALNGQTCILSLGEMAIGKALTIDASALPNGMTIDANRTSRHFFANGANTTLTLKALTFANGNDTRASSAALGAGVGGSVLLLDGKVFCQRCTFAGNTARDGGAVFLQGAGTSRLENCTIAGNRATESGGGVEVISGNCFISNCTISGNTGTGGGGGLYLESPASVSLSNSLIAGNSDSAANDIFNNGGTLTSIGANLIGSNATVSGTFPVGQPNANGQYVGTQSTPLDPKLSPLGYFGGPTQTMHPLIGSAAIDAGGTTDPGGTDQRGFPRFVDGDASGTAQLDIGAVEVWPRARSLFFTDHPVTTAADEDDGSILSGFGTGTSLREVVKYAPNSTPGGFIITFSPALAGQTITLGGTEIPLNNNLFIDASNLSSPVTISGNNASRVFNIPAGASVAMHHLVITNGRSADGVIGPGGTHGADGGGILNAGSLGLFFCTISNNRSGDGGIITGFSLGTPGGSGGAIDSSGPVSLATCTLSGNSTGSGLLVSSTAASGGSGGAIYCSAPLSLTACTLSSNATGRGGVGGNEGGDGGNGGAIFSGHSLSLTACTLSGNTTGNGSLGDNGGGRGGGGGGIFSIGPLILNTCTLSGNVTGSGGFNSQSSTGGVGGNGGSGGGIRKNDSIPYRLTASTLAGNRTGPGGGGTSGVGNFGVGGGVSGGNAILKHCLIAQNIGASGAADDANVSSLAYLQANLVRTSASSSSTGPAPLTGDPLLAPLGDYGGPTFTMALKPASPARNAATGSTATSDQRGFPIVGTPDLGAYEAGTITNYANFIWETLPASATDAQHAAIFDFDGDGASNGDEWLAFTHPGNPTSHFGITSFSKTGSIFSITFPTVLGRNYFVEYSLDLLTWSPFTSVFAGTGNPIAVLGNFPGATKVFIRARVGP